MRDFQSRGSLVQRQSGEAAELNEFAGTWIDTGKLGQRFVKSQQIARDLGNFDLIQQRLRLKMSTPFQTFSFSCRVDQDSTHRFGRRRKKVTSRIPILRNLGIDKSQVRFVNQSRRLQDVFRLLATHLCGGQFSQFVINERKQRLCSVRFPRIDARQNLSDFMHPVNIKIGVNADNGIVVTANPQIAKSPPN